MSDRQTFRLVHDVARNGAIAAVRAAPQGYVVAIRPPNRSLDQNAKFHAAVADIAKAFPRWAGLDMDEDDWKALLVVSHAKATKAADAIRVVPDLEGGGMVQLRESTAAMSKDRASSLIEYVTAWAVSNGVKLKDEAA